MIINNIIKIIENISDELRSALGPSPWIKARKNNPESFNVKDPYVKSKPFCLPIAFGVENSLIAKGIQIHFQSLIGGQMNLKKSVNAIKKLAGIIQQLAIYIYNSLVLIIILSY
jgi:hypothetical protein